MDKHIETIDIMIASYSHIRRSDAEWEAMEAAKDALRRAQLENKPLTLDELRDMDGEPVWMNQKKQWVFIASTSDSPYAQVWYFRKGFMYTVLYHHEKFYRHKPEEEHHEDD